MVKINTFTEERIDTQSFVSKVFNDNDVKSIETSLSKNNTIVAHNFTREVFQSTHSGESRWTPTTTSARGLFTIGEKVVGRGFPKFFALGEIESEETDLKKFTFPINVYEKWNGFLAIAFFTTEDGLIVTNKSGKENAYHTIEITNKVIDENPSFKEKLVNFLKTNPNYSVALEIIAPTYNDSHIVYYKENHIVPLAVIENETGTILPEFNNEIGIKTLKTLNSYSELKDFVQFTKSNESDFSEGYVLRGKNGFQLKLKTPFYLRAKSVRGRLEKHIPLHNTNELKWHDCGKDWFTEASLNHTKFSAKWALEKQKEFLNKRSN